jgi:sugar lactone lactonase YvrE
VTEIRCALPARALLGEGPLWDPEDRVLYWVDIKGRYVTTASIGLSADALAAQPWAGGILALDPGVRGLPEARFRG